VREERGIWAREPEQSLVYFGGKPSQNPPPARYLTSQSNLAYRLSVKHTIRKRCQKGVSG